jgi:hypothetical protein
VSTLAQRRTSASSEASQAMNRESGPSSARVSCARLQFLLVSIQHERQKRRECREHGYECGYLTGRKRSRQVRERESEKGPATVERKRAQRPKTTGITVHTSAAVSTLHRGPRWSHGRLHRHTHTYTHTHTHTHTHTQIMRSTPMRKGRKVVLERSLSIYYLSLHPSIHLRSICPLSISIYPANPSISLYL